MLPNREGRFKAYVIEHGVSETGPNNLATFICKFGLQDELVSGQWVPLGIEDAGMNITGYFYLERKDGAINNVAVDQLKSAFGWDGRDPMWLQDSDFSQHQVQVKLGYENYNGQQRLKVQFVDAAEGNGGAVPRADDGTRRSIANRLGSKLRALAGGTPVQTPKPQGKPISPPSKPTQTARPAPAPAAPAAKPLDADGAWAAFVGQFSPNADQKFLEREWFRIAAELFPGRDMESFTAEDWARFVAEAPSKTIPF